MVYLSLQAVSRRASPTACATGGAFQGLWRRAATARRHAEVRVCEAVVDGGPVGLAPPSAGAGRHLLYGAGQSGPAVRLVWRVVTATFWGARARLLDGKFVGPNGPWRGGAPSATGNVA